MMTSVRSTTSRLVGGNTGLALVGGGNGGGSGASHGLLQRFIVGGNSLPPPPPPPHNKRVREDLIPLYADRLAVWRGGEEEETSKRWGNILASYETRGNLIGVNTTPILGMLPAKQRREEANLACMSSSSLDDEQQQSKGRTQACQDCGNKAKKDCSHLRCRSCCKSRGFECATHLKSTWVPAVKRRERQLVQLDVPKSKRARMLSVAFQQQQQPPPSDLNSLPQLYPQEVKTEAVFKCLRVTAIDDGQNEYAYQATTQIGGHVFKGLLYDQGPHHHHKSSPPLHLGARSTLHPRKSTSAIAYGTPSDNAFISGMH